MPIFVFILMKQNFKNYFQKIKSEIKGTLIKYTLLLIRRRTREKNDNDDDDNIYVYIVCSYMCVLFI